MVNDASILSGPQAPTMTGLKIQYNNLLLPVQEQFWSQELTCAPAIVGKRFKESNFRLMYVGRAVNGWDVDWKKGSVDDLVEQVFSYDFEMASISENPNQNGYNFNRSGFWQLCKSIMKLSGEEENWSDKILWSNLYKVAPYGGGNPDNDLIKKTIQSCIKILTYEFRYYRPTHVVFVTNDWWFDPISTFNSSFADKLKISIKHNTKDVILGQKICHIGGNSMKVVITKRPEGLAGITREEHAKLILDAFESL